VWRKSLSRSRIQSCSVHPSSILVSSVLHYTSSHSALKHYIGWQINTNFGNFIQVTLKASTIPPLIHAPSSLHMRITRPMALSRWRLSTPFSTSHPSLSSFRHIQRNPLAPRDPSCRSTESYNNPTIHNRHSHRIEPVPRRPSLFAILYWYRDSSRRDMFDRQSCVRLGVITN
jgi:hypothetical protein